MRTLRIAILVLSALAVVLSFWLAAWLGRDVVGVPTSLSRTSADAVASDHLREGLDLERSGRLSAAVAEYHKALKADDKSIRALAAGALERARAKRVAGLPSWLPVRWDEALGFLIGIRRWIVAALVLAAILVVALDLVRRRRGVAIGLFPAYGTGDSAASEAFRSYLFQALQDHQRVFSSSWLRPLGGVPSGDLLMLSRDAGDPLSRALETVKAGELKAVVGFSVAEFFRLLRRDVPAYVLDGQIRCEPGQIVVVTELRGTGQPPFLLRESASSLEYPRRLPGMGPPPARAPVRVAGGRLLVEELRADHEELAAVARVLAAKLWHGLTRGVRGDLRPHSWTTFLKVGRAMAPYVRS
jgi:hypothetical protein